MNSNEIIDDFGGILAAAGTGTRFGDGDKLLADLKGKPVFIHSLETLLACCAPGRVALVAPSDETAAGAFLRALRDRGLSEKVIVVPGGDNRTESVMNGLKALPETIDLVAVHDAARPLATPDLLRRCAESARRLGSGVAARRMIDTIKEADADGRVEATLDRNRLWAVETPQVFRFRELREDYAAALESGETFTDDAAVREFRGGEVFLVEHPEINLKITVPRDLVVARALTNV